MEKGGASGAAAKKGAVSPLKQTKTHCVRVSRLTKGGKKEGRKEADIFEAQNWRKEEEEENSRTRDRVNDDRLVRWRSVWRAKEGGGTTDSVSGFRITNLPSLLPSASPH